MGSLDSSRIGAQKDSLPVPFKNANTVAMSDPIEPYPKIGRRVTRFIITFGILGAIAMGLFFYLGSEGHEELANAMLIAFFLLVPFGLLGGFFMLYTVRCPRCGGATKTLQNKKMDMWQAHCERCKVTWDLGIGCDSGP
jgi:hypothetical protein